MATEWQTASGSYRNDTVTSDWCSLSRRVGVRVSRRPVTIKTLSWARLLTEAERQDVSDIDAARLGGSVGPATMAGLNAASFAAQQLQLVLVFCKQSLESQVLADDGQDLAQQVPLPQTLETGQTVGTVWWHLETMTAVACI